MKTELAQFKSLIDEFVVSIRTDFADRDISPSREIYMGLMVQYLQNLIENSKAQEKFVDNLFQKSWSKLNVENVGLMRKRCCELAALSYLLYEEFENEANG